MIDKKHITFINLLLFVFIIVSSILIYKVYDIKIDIKYKVSCISSSNSIEDIVISLINKLDRGEKQSSDEVKETIEAIRKKIEKHPELDSISYLLDSKKSLILREKLISINLTCRQVITECRSQLNKASLELDNYWIATSILLLIACIIALSLGLTIFNSSKTKKRLGKEKVIIDQLLNKSVDLIISCDLAGNITEFNNAAEKSLGYAKEEILGKSISSISGEKGIRVLDKLLETGVFVGEVINKRKDGSRYLANLSANLLYDDSGAVIGSMGVSRDISSEKAKEQRYTSIVENSSHVIYTIELNGKCSFVNETVSKFFGYSVNEIVGRPFLEFVYEEDINLVSNFYKNQAKRLVKDTTLEFRAKSKDGSFKWVSQDVNTLLSTINPKEIAGFQGVVRVIDEVKRAEIKIRETEIKYMELFNNSTDLIHSIDLQGNFNYVNEKWKNTLSYSEDELKNLNLFDIIHPNSQEHCISLINDIKENRADNDLFTNYKVITKYGQILTLEGGLSFGKENGKINSIQSFLRDVTEQRKAQEVIEKQNKEINSSISYAESIQQSVLPGKDEIRTIFPDSFLFYKPRDIVSGDFYIVDYLKTNDKVKMPSFIVGDCTGHGVPGAVLSLMCNALTKESFTTKDVNSPAEALDFIREKLVSFFRSGSKKLMSDGMDAAFCVLNREKGELYFAGANLPCLIIRNGELTEIKGDKQHVGYSYNKSPFTPQRIPVEKGDAIFIYSDGYHDQFGGERNKKFTKKKFHKLLEEHASLPMNEIGEIIEENFYQWKGKYEQIDDITILGVRV